MICERCGVYCPPDRETGYDGDHYCPDCTLRASEDVEQEWRDLVDELEADDETESPF
jgi:hypothetical protein